jgi:hypothetical protein
MTHVSPGTGSHPYAMICYTKQCAHDLTSW